MIYTNKIIVRYAETDKMGIVHNSVYPIWYEETRVNFIKSLGIKYSEIEELGIMLPLSEIKIKYIKPAFFEEQLNVNIKINKLTSVKIEFEYTIYNQSKNLINIGKTIHPFINSEFNLINLKKYDYNLFKIISKGYKKEL